jgi:hypothetical protein
MGEDDLKKALLRQETRIPGGSEGKEELKALAAIGRWMRWSRLLAFMTVSLWVALAGGLILAVFGFLTFVYPKFVKIAVDGEPNREAVKTVVHVTGQFALYRAAIWAGLLVLAAGSTVCLVVVSRQATLRQIRASLAEIVAELRTMGSTGGLSQTPRASP